MIQAEEYLPNRIVLPVNIALLLHWYNYHSLIHSLTYYPSIHLSIYFFLLIII